jgi:hypothetical protein
LVSEQINFEASRSALRERAGTLRRRNDFKVKLLRQKINRKDVSHRETGKNKIGDVAKHLTRRAKIS